MMEILAQDPGGGSIVTITTIVVAAFVQIALAVLAFMSAQRANLKADTASVKADKIVEQNAEHAIEISKVKDTVVITEGLVNSRSAKQDAKISELEEMVRQLKNAASDRRVEFQGGAPEHKAEGPPEGT
jgi:thymidylate synthase